MKEYWRGGVEQWECDNMGHMNVRFWMRRFYDSLVLFANNIGLNNAFSESAISTLLMRQAHLKFIKEAHVGAPLYLKGGICEVNGNQIVYFAEIRHSKSEELAASLIAKLEMVNNKNGEIIPINDEIIAKNGARIIDIPEYARPRSIDLDQIIIDNNIDWAREKGFKRIGLMPVRPGHLDIFGRFLPENYFAFISESVPNLVAHREKDQSEKDQKPNNADGKIARIGAAVIENRFDYYEPPKAGDVLEIVSGVVAIADKTRTLQHRIYNTETKKVVCISHAIVANFDLDQRKAVSFTKEYREKIIENMINL